MKRFVIAAAVAAAKAYAAEELFAMHVGDSWKFEAKVQWTVDNGSNVRTATVPWEMTVVDVVDSSRVRAVIVRGFPTHLAWSDPTQPAKLAFDIVVTRPDGLWMDDDEADSEQAAHRIAERAIAGETVGHALLHFPLRENDCADKQDPDRDDGMYCWLLTAQPSQSKSRSWRIVYRTNPDQQFIDFTEGVGFTEYSYEHHGTIASAHAVLKKWTVGSPKK